MTTTVPFNLNLHTPPVTPPPENPSFPMPQRPETYQQPFNLRAFQVPTLKNTVNAQLKFLQEQQQRQAQPNSPLSQRQQQQQQQQQQQEQPQSQPQPSFPQVPPAGPLNADAAAFDPKNLAMASRIATYYQQRCQAITNYQQQRCQAWATMHRQRCQEMVQAAMLVVAWYIRDRIRRRRRRLKCQFRNGLSDRSSRSKVTKGEVVRRWVLQVPDAVLSPSELGSNRPVDKEETEFNMDQEQPVDKDTRLFSVADNLIKSQLSKIEVPLMGALSFDESDSESEDEPGEAENEEDDDDAGEEQDQDFEGDEELYDADLSIDDYEDDEFDSGSEQNGTGDGQANDRTQESSVI